MASEERSTSTVRPKELVATSEGMVRENKDDKLNYLSYFTPEVLLRYAQHMKKGELKHGRGNFKKGGYPKSEYLESAMRHLLNVWAQDEGYVPYADEDDAAAVMFNMVGYMMEDEATRR